MSYEKKVAPNVIRFYYVTDTIFDEVAAKSAFKAKTIKDEKGQTDFDEYAITTDEKVFMKKYLKEAMLEVFKVLFKVIYGSINHDTEITIVGTGEVTASYVDITDNSPVGSDSLYRTINLDLLDQKINNALVDFILFKWYYLKGLGDDAKLLKQEFDEALNEISAKSLALRLPV